jgi:hypothetical protein
MWSKTAVAAALILTGCWASAGIAHAEPAPPPGPKTTVDADGTYVVGTDIAPGTYSSAGPIPDGACYWKRVNGSRILDNALSKRPQVVHIEPTDTAFTTNDCQPWQLTPCQPGCGPAPASALDVLADLGKFLLPRQGAVPPGGTP